MSIHRELEVSENNNAEDPGVGNNEETCRQHILVHKHAIRMQIGKQCKGGVHVLRSVPKSRKRRVLPPKKAAILFGVQTRKCRAFAA